MASKALRAVYKQLLRQSKQLEGKGIPQLEVRLPLDREAVSPARPPARPELGLPNNVLLLKPTHPQSTISSMHAMQWPYNGGQHGWEPPYAEFHREALRKLLPWLAVVGGPDWI